MMFQKEEIKQKTFAKLTKMTDRVFLPINSDGDTLGEYIK